MSSPAVLSSRLLAWYRKNARDLPWRRTNDPYKIWVSEIMLQQTQVDTVIPYYERWLERFPTLAALAEAPQEEVMKCWAGLGYYRRARMLHAGAQKLHAGGSKLPASAAELIKLPGIGRYTAGAIASIAFGEKTPVLDGNVIRILTRIFAIKSDTLLPATIKKLWGLADSIMPDKSPGDFNQAMMELGATVCFPENPQCGRCPVHKLCKAKALGKPADFPVKSRREKLEKIRTAALVLRRGGRVLLQKQAAHERWGGLWMFPHWPDRRKMLKETGFEKSRLKKLMTVRHGFTRYQIDLDVFVAPLTLPSPHRRGNFARQFPPLPEGEGWGEGLRWVLVKNLENLPLPSPHRKIAHALAQNHD